MSYKSPVSVLARFAETDDTLDPKELLKIQKRVLVEIELSGRSHIVLEGKEFTKHDIISIFDQLKDEDNLHYHQLIFENKALLNLLENSTFSGTQLFDSDIVHHKEYPGFKAFVSPLLAIPLGKELNKAFNERNFLKGRKLLQGFRLIDEVHLEEALSHVKSSLQFLISEIEQQAQKADPNLSIDHFRFIPNHEFIQFLNELPAAMDQFRTGLAIALIRLTSMLQQRQARFVYLIYLSLKSLHCRPDIKEVIYKNAGVTASWGSLENSRWGPGDSSNGDGGGTNYDHQRTTSKTRAALALIAWLVLFIFFILSGRSNSRNNEPKIKMEVSDVSLNDLEEIHFKQHLLGVSKALIDSVFDQEFDTVSVKTEYSGLRIYPQNFGSIQSYKRGKSHLTLMNQSTYDVVVFLNTADQNYSAFLAQGEKLEFKIRKGDALSFYSGNCWNPEGIILSTDFFRRKVNDVYGYFNVADSSTIDYLKKRFILDCSPMVCDRINASFINDEKKQFLFQYDVDIFKKTEYLQEIK